MNDAVSETLASSKRFAVVVRDAIEFLVTLPDDSIDLLFTSPPYLEARTYGIGAGRKLEPWVEWMIQLVTVASKKVKGLIAINCEGQTKDFRYLPSPFLLMADLHRAGFNLRKPPVFHRSGIPGSGGPDWLRNDYEPIVCVTRGGRLPWSDNTACGHIPRWAPGGEMSHRLGNGTRVNQWVSSFDKGGSTSTADGTARTKTVKPSHRVVTKKPRTVITRPREGMHSGQEDTIYSEPALANPGNVIKCNVGGGQLGHDLAHENEAPFPLELAAFFVKSFCPPDGITCDPFSGSGTVLHACHENGRRFVGCDIRQSQVDIALRRVSGVTPGMFDIDPS